MLLKVLKWLLYVFLGFSLTVLSAFLVFSLIDRRIPVNQTTKTCLVTGASSGIGREIAREMVKRDWTVIGVARGEEKLKELERELGNKFIFTCVM